MPTKGKYRHVVRAVHDSVWLIRLEKLEAMRELLDLRQQGRRFTPDEVQTRIGVTAKRPRLGTLLAARRRPSGGMSNDKTEGSKVALLRVHGVLTQRMNLMTQVSGGTSYEQFARKLEQAGSDPRVGTIVVEFDTPGGSSFGVSEAFAVMNQVRQSKRIVGVVNSLCASGGYHLAIGCDEIVITPGGLVGSVGAYMLHADTSKAQDKAGIKTEVMRMPSQKAEGVGGEPLTDSARRHVMKLVTQVYDRFAEHVSERRGVSREMIRKRWAREYTAEDALRLGMVDRIATLAEVLSELGVGDTSDEEDDDSRPAFSLEGLDMDPKVFSLLVQIGMCQINSSTADANNALARFFAVRSKLMPDSAEEQARELKAYIDERDAPPESPPVKQAQQPAATPPVENRESSDDRAAQITAAIRLSSLPDADKLELMQSLVSDKSVTVGKALETIQDRIAAKQKSVGGVTIENGPAERDKFFTAARDAVLMRSFGGHEPQAIFSRREGQMVDWKPDQASRGSRSLRSLPRLAEECLIRMGASRQRVDQMSPHDIAKVAMGLASPMDYGLFVSSDGPAYNLSGMFSNILLDASNVVLRKAYMEVETTFQTWAGQGESLPDFKPVHKVIGGELPDPKAVPEDGEFDEVTYADGKESYKLTVWGEIFSISWQAVVNDQLGEFTAIPQKQGRAMRRKQNKLVYAVLKDNAALSDGTALFASGHSNNTTGAVTNYASEFSKLRAKMANQTGLTSGTTLNIQPKFVIYPIADPTEHNILTTLASQAPPAVGGSTPGSSGVANIWRGRLTPVGDAELTTANGGVDATFYMAADFMDVETVEYAYLQGLETPALDQVMAFNSLAIRYRIYQAFATKALDFRGLQRSVGS